MKTTSCFPRLSLWIFSFALASGVLTSCRSQDDEGVDGSELERTRSQGGATLPGTVEVAPDSGKRVALVIGNSNYEEKPLANPVNDARVVSEGLREVGFTVIQALDQSQAGMEKAVRTFSDELEAGATGIFYYAGHGIEVDKQNYLLPVDARIKKKYEVKHEAVNVDRVLAAMAGSGCRMKMVILDCCRDNPFARSWRSSGESGGLAEMAVPEGTLLCYATNPQNVAADGVGENSPFTAAFVKALEVEGLNHDDFFRKVRRDVLAETNRQQRPWTSNDLEHAFYFRPLVGSDGASEQTPESDLAKRLEWKQKQDRMAEEFALAEELGTAAGWQEYLRVWGKVRNPYSKEDESLLGTAKEEAAQLAMLGLRAGDKLEFEIAPGMTMPFRWCPPGSFVMGSPASEVDRNDNEDQVKVTFSRGYWMGRYEVTQEQWQAVMGDNPSEFKGPRLPVEQVSWEDAQEFLGKLNAQSRLPRGWDYVLPTEAQWEYACRAGTTTPFSFGTSLRGEKANANGSYPYGTTREGPFLRKTVDGGSYRANGWGLHYMHGNVAEWCADSYEKELQGGVNPTGPRDGRYRVFRGGSWSTGAQDCRAASRSGLTPSFRCSALGFRVCLVGPKR